MIRFGVIIGLLLTAFQLNAQELNCTININADKISTSNKQVFKTLENALTEFVNQKKWTNKKFKPQERIQCAMTLNISEQSSSNVFKGSLQVQVSRPVFNSSYLTPIFNYKDSDFTFNYTEFEPLRFDPNSFDSNLVSVITFYVYTILGMDADTFAQNGGDRYFKLAQNVVLQAQQSGYLGWQAKGIELNRFTLIDDLLSNTFESFRTTMYRYHLKGLDTFTEDKKKAKESIKASILLLQKLYNRRPNAFLIRVFMDAKADEIVSVFSGGPQVDTKALKESLTRISAVNSSKWQKIN